MSVLNKVPFINQVINDLNDEELASLLNLMNGSGDRTELLRTMNVPSGNRTNISSGDKGVHMCSLQVGRTLYYGYLLYTDVWCVLVHFTDFQTLSIFNIDVANVGIETVSEYLDIDELRGIMGDLFDGERIKLPQIVKISWETLKNLRDSGQLASGVFYRIVDYDCMVNDASGLATSAMHPFDIIVLALDESHLSEDARACHSDRDVDGYFEFSNLSAWKLWYSLDNDTSRFAWADSTNGKGVIYRIIDEFNNDIPYDFKNILFTDSASTPKYINAYTFTYTENGVIKDASLLASKNCYSNIMKEYIESSRQLNFNVFYSTGTSFDCYSNIFDIGCSHNTLSYACCSNIFGALCSLNTFGNSCYYNIFGSNCSRNTFAASCTVNTFAASCYANRFGTGCSFNTFGTSCASNTFGNDCSINTFGAGCTYNIFGEKCESNAFGNRCHHNTFSNRCFYNTFGNYCANNTLGNYWISNSFSCQCEYIIVSQIDYAKNIVVENGCKYLTIECSDTDAAANNQLQNVHIHVGVYGASSNNRLTITVPDRNLDYETSYQMTGSNTVTL